MLNLLQLKSASWQSWGTRGLLFLFAVGCMLNLLYFKQSMPTLPLSTPSTVLPSQPVSVQQLSQIPKQSLFGKAPLKAPQAAVSHSHWQLRGILHHTRSSQSQALMSEPGKPEKVYQVGSILPDGSKIKKILSDSVEIEQGGQIQRLALAPHRLAFLP